MLEAENQIVMETAAFFPEEEYRGRLIVELVAERKSKQDLDSPTH